jgi:hypothetical protein
LRAVCHRCRCGSRDVGEAVEVAGDDHAENAGGQLLPLGRKLVQLAHPLKELSIADRDRLGAGRQQIEGDLQDARDPHRGVERWQALALLVTGDLHIVDADFLRQFGDRQVPFLS